MAVRSAARTRLESGSPARCGGGPRCSRCATRRSCCAPRAIGEPVLVETLVSESAVGALNKGVLDRLPRADEVDLDTPAVGPGVERPASEFRAVVADKHRGERALLGELFEHADHAEAG